MKYIVYLTTNLVNHKIYVGVHSTEDPTKFDNYYGNGVRRGNPLNNPKTPFQYAIKKYGYDNFSRSTIRVFDTMEEALDLEAEIVDEEFLKRADTYNATLGGGLPPLLNKVIYQYTKQGEFIKEWNSIVEASKYLNIAESAIGKAILYKRTSADFLWSDVKLDKLNIEEFNVYDRKIPVYIYDSTGLFVKGFSSMADCCRGINGNLSHLQRAIKLGCKTCGYYVSTKLTDLYEKPVIPRLTGLYHQYDLDGNYIKSFLSVKDAESILGTRLPDLNNSIRMEYAYKGFIWKRGDKLDKIEPYVKASSPKRIAQLDDNGNVLKVFNTLREARKEFPNVSKVLNGNATHCHGFKFKYYTEEVNEIV